MSYYKVCPYCGCNLDPGEVCDCDKKEAAAVLLTPTTARRDLEMNPIFPHPIISETLGGCKHDE